MAMLGKGLRAVDVEIRSPFALDESFAKRRSESARLADVRPNYPRPTSFSAMEGRPRRRDQFRSKTGVWKEPMLLLQRMRGRRAPGFFRQPQQPPKVSSTQYAAEYSSNNRPSHWVRFWRKLRFDGGKKVDAARADWLNYDAQSYAMNFEKDEETPYDHSSLPMPKLSGPGAREIVTVLLKRSSSANRNSGAILIPRPVFVIKHETSTPLWKRRCVRAPSSLDVKVRTVGMRRPNNAAGA